MKRRPRDVAEADDLRAAGKKVIEIFDEEGVEDNMVSDLIEALEISMTALALAGENDLSVRRDVVTLDRAEDRAA